MVNNICNIKQIKVVRFKSFSLIPFLYILLFVLLGCASSHETYITYSINAVLTPSDNIEKITQTDWVNIQKVLESRLKFNTIKSYKLNLDTNNNTINLLFNTNDDSPLENDILDQLCRIGSVQFVESAMDLEIDNNIESASVITRKMGCFIGVKFNESGTKKLEQMTQLDGDSIDIYMDGNLITTERTIQPITTGNASIEINNANLTELNAIAAIINSGPLLYKLDYRIISSS